MVPRSFLVVIVLLAGCSASLEAKETAATPVTDSTKSAPAKPGTTPATSGLPDGSALLTVPAFRTAYLKALGKYSKEEWLAKLDGPAPPSRRVKIGGAEYLYIASCKPHDCADNNTVLLYSSPKRAVYGKVHVAGKSAMIGNPPPALAKEIGMLWVAEWGPSR